MLCQNVGRGRRIALDQSGCGGAQRIFADDQSGLGDGGQQPFVLTWE